MTEIIQSVLGRSARSITSGFQGRKGGVAALCVLLIVFSVHRSPVEPHQTVHDFAGCHTPPCGVFQQCRCSARVYVKCNLHKNSLHLQRGCREKLTSNGQLREKYFYSGQIRMVIPGNSLSNRRCHASALLFPAERCSSQMVSTPLRSCLCSHLITSFTSK